jgi:hypothetical protein
MLDDQRDATFIIVDAVRLGDDFPQSTWNLLGNLSRSQKPVSPLWIDECVRRGILVNLDQYIIRSSSTAPPTMRHSTEEKTTASEVPYKRGKKPTDIEAPYKHPSTPLALGVTATFKRKRRLSQSDVDLPDDVVRPTGIIRKGVDPRVRQRPSAAKQSSNSETSPTASIPQPAPATHSPGAFGDKKLLSRSSVYDRPDATTLDLPSTQTALDPIKDDRYKVADCSNQVTPRGVNIIFPPVPSIKPSFPNAAAATMPPARPTEVYRPDTPPLPSTPLASPPDLPLYHLARVSFPGLDTNLCSIRLSRLPTSSTDAGVSLDLPNRLDSGTPSSLQPILVPTQAQTSAYDDQMSEVSSSSSSDFSTYMPSEDEEAPPPNKLGGASHPSRSPTVPSSMMLQSKVQSSLLIAGAQMSQGTPRQVVMLVSQARLGKLADELDKWLHKEPTDTPYQFLKALDLKVGSLSHNKCYHG